MIRHHRPHKLPRLHDGRWDALGIVGTERKLIRTARACYARYGEVLLGYSDLANYPEPLAQAVVMKAVVLGLLPAGTEVKTHGTLDDSEVDLSPEEIEEVQARVQLIKAAKQIVAIVRPDVLNVHPLHTYELDALFDQAGVVRHCFDRPAPPCEVCGHEMTRCGRKGRALRCYRCHPPKPRYRNQERQECLA